jgi:AraC-like DNA-binding protein
VFKPGASDKTLPLASPLLEDTYTRLCETLLARTRTEEGLVGQLYGLLVRAGRQMPDVAEAARRLHVSERTLHRRLARQGLSFQRLIDNTREEHARYLLATGVLPIERVAELVGFTEAASFSRAFKRWTGMSPLRFRQVQTTPKK